MIWLTSVIVSLAPLMGWKDEKFMERIEAGKCMVRIHSYYQGTGKYKKVVFSLMKVNDFLILCNFYQQYYLLY